MGFEITHGEESFPVLRFDGVLRLSEVIEGFTSLTPSGFGVSNFLLLVDLRDVEKIDVTVEESHELVRLFRSLNQLGPELRVALVAQGQVRRDAEEHVLIRDTFTGRDPDQLARLVSFDEPAEAREWLDGSD